jgi:transcriptional regulator GlxA family with amidase domain
MHVGVYVVDGVFDSGLAVVSDVLTAANGLLEVEGSSLTPWSLTLLGASTQARTASGLLAPTTPVRELDEPVDLLVVPAMGVTQPRQVLAAAAAPGTQGVRDLVRATRDAGLPVAAACSSTFLLAQAGVLDGLAATTSWWLGPAFRASYPHVHLDEERTLVSSGGLTTAGAAFAHIDLALSIVMSRSPAVADLVSRYMLLDTRPSQAVYAMPALLAGHHPLVAAFERWARANLDRPLGIAEGARALAVSERTLQRSVAGTLGMSPLDFVQELRIDEATRLLRSTTLSVEAVAARVGYRNAATLRQLVRRRRNTTVGRIRERAVPRL